MKDKITREIITQVGVIENNNGRLSPIVKEALTEKDKINLVDDLIYRAILFAEEWKIDFDFRVQHQKKVRDLEKRIQEKIKAKSSPKKRA